VVGGWIRLVDTNLRIAFLPSDFGRPVTVNLPAVAHANQINRVSAAVGECLPSFDATSEMVRNGDVVNLRVIAVLFNANIVHDVNDPVVVTKRALADTYDGIHACLHTKSSRLHARTWSDCGDQRIPVAGILGRHKPVHHVYNCLMILDFADFGLKFHSLRHFSSLAFRTDVTDHIEFATGDLSQYCFFSICLYGDIMNVTLRQLQAFVAVAESGNFSRAADRLHVAQSAVSVLVRELERNLVIRLFDRTTRRVELTDAGVEFRATAEKLIADLDHAVQHTHDLVERKRGRLVVAAPPLLAAALLPDAISAFQKHYPGISVALIDARTDEIVSRVKSGQADIGVGTFAADEDGLSRTRLTKDTLMFFCETSQAKINVTQPRWRDLKGLPLITLTRDSGIRALVESGYQAAGLSLDRPAFEVSQIATALALVEAGLGVSILPRYALVSCKNRNIVARVLSHPTISREVVAITRSGRSLPPAGGDFIQLLQRNAKLRRETQTLQS
jgi:DNA-binding transcriptional LysR family regulator